MWFRSACLRDVSDSYITAAAGAMWRTQTYEIYLAYVEG